jgi:hypothetical protein
MQALSTRKGMDTLDQELVRTILREIEARLNQGVLPVHNGHMQALSQGEDVLKYLLLMKEDGLISGDLVTKGANNAPFRMTNIRLTYLGIRVLRS